MRIHGWQLTGATMLVLLVGMAAGQPPPEPGTKDKPPKPPPNEEKAILEEIREAYKAPFEVHEDVLKALRKSYEQPSPDREAKIFKELRRLYELSPDREAAILKEIRTAYDKRSTEQETRVFQEITRAPRLANGTVPATVQADQARKLFQRFDANGDGVLTTDEMPDDLRADRGRWDTNRDGLIDQAEYATYHLGRLRHLSEQVVAGQIDLKLKRGGPGTDPQPADPTRPADPIPPADVPATDTIEKRPVVARAGRLPPGLPDWFVKLDSDGDGQIGLYEWKTSSRPLAEFSDIDRNGDGLITPDEMLRYLTDHPDAKSAVTTSGKSKKN
jgi:Ca2+-binding EF-hand superfamily protein